MRARHLLATFALMLSAGLAAAPVRAAEVPGAPGTPGEWVSYRDAYRVMVRFEKYGGPKNLLQNGLQVLPRERGALGEGAQLALAGKTVQVRLPLDVLGRTVLPLQKAAYDENASLVLNRKGVAFTVRPLVAIAPRADGQYDAAELRTACAQALEFARWAAAADGARQCVGVRFVFAKKAEAGVRLRRADGAEQALPVLDGDDGAAGVVYRFSSGAERAQVVTVNAPVAVLPVIE